MRKYEIPQNFTLSPTSSITNPHSGVLIPSNAKKGSLSFLFLAEREGFEPPVPLSTPVFKTGAIDHSATSPRCFFVKYCGLPYLTMQR